MARSIIAALLAGGWSCVAVALDRDLTSAQVVPAVATGSFSGGFRVPVTYSWAWVRAYTKPRAKPHRSVVLRAAARSGRNRRAHAGQSGLLAGLSPPTAAAGTWLPPLLSLYLIASFQDLGTVWGLLPFTAVGTACV